MCYKRRGMRPGLRIAMMSVAPSGPKGRGRWQFGLLGWICWIVGAGAALAVAIWLVIALILQVGRVARGSGRKGPAIAWRLTALGMLSGLLAEASRLLAIEPDPDWAISSLRRGGALRLVTVATALLVSGL